MGPLELVGYDRALHRIRAGDRLRTILYWRTRTAAPESLTLMLTLSGEQTRQSLDLPVNGDSHTFATLCEMKVLAFDRTKLFEHRIILVLELFDLRAKFLAQLLPLIVALRRIGMPQLNIVELLAQFGILVQQLLRELGSALKAVSYTHLTLPTTPYV